MAEGATTEPYPERCAFCPISDAYQPSSSSPVPVAPDPERISPQAHLILSTPHILAFLDILPIAPGHILLTTKKHYHRLSELHAPNDPDALETSKQIGKWLPILSAALKDATGIEDWNVVQNNGARAAQVVPHVHFHLIPRYQEGTKEAARMGKADVGMLKSWKMFGRGARSDLDEEEGEELAKVLREQLRVQIGESCKEGGKARL